MLNVTDRPLLFFVVSLLGLALSEWIGWCFSRKRALQAEEREDFGVIQAATLTLLGLIIGFSFSMALGRYDQRKNCEAEEANAIGTEYARAGLLPAEAQTVRKLLSDYLDQRILFYETRDKRRVANINARTDTLEAELWSAVRIPAVAHPSPVAALAVAGMNDVLNARGYTQAAWWNRIPTAAWELMAAIAILSNLLVGFGSRRHERDPVLLLVLPLMVAVAFLLIADIDSPGWGLIQVLPRNLLSLSQSLHAQ